MFLRIEAEGGWGRAGHPEATPLPLQVLRIGDVCIGTMPAEVFCEIGLEFRKRSPVQPAFLISLAHGYFGYLPTPRHHALGGYETWLGTSRLEPQASEKMLDALLQMAAETREPRAGRRGDLAGHEPAGTARLGNDAQRPAANGGRDPQRGREVKQGEERPLDLLVVPLTDRETGGVGIRADVYDAAFANLRMTPRQGRNCQGNR